MPTVELPIPGYNPDNKDSATFRIEGMRFIVQGEQARYRPSFEISDSNKVTIVPHEDVDMSKLRSTHFFTEVDIQHQRVFYSLTDGVAEDISGEITYIEGLPREANIVFSDRGSAYVLITSGSEKGYIYEMNDKTFAPTLVNEKSGGGLEDGSLHSNLVTRGYLERDIIAVETWLDRVFILVGNMLIWSDTGDIGEFRPEFTDTEGANISTNAGYQIFDEFYNGVDVGSFGDNLYVFGTNNIYVANLSDISFQFTFTEYPDRYTTKGRVAAHRAGLYFFTDTSFMRINANGVQPVDINIRFGLQDFYRELDDDNFSVTIVDDFVIFHDRLSGIMFQYDTYYNQSRTTKRDDVHIVGYYGVRSGMVIGDLNDGIGTYDHPIGDFAGESGRSPCAIVKTGDDYVFHFWSETHPDTIEFNLGGRKGGKQYNICKISIPEFDSDNYNIQLKESDSNSWGEVYMPDSRNEVRIESIYDNPDVKVNVNGSWKELTRFEIDMRLRSV